MNLYIADTHFGHKNILLHDHRPFRDTEEMWNAMKYLWNGRVTKTDDVWIIGDFCFCNKKNPVEYLRELKGKKHLIIGNHDKDLLKNEAAMAYFETVDYYRKIHDNGNTIILCHYPIVEWDGFFHGADLGDDLFGGGFGLLLFFDQGVQHTIANDINFCA